MIRCRIRDNHGLDHGDSDNYGETLARRIHRIVITQKGTCVTNDESNLVSTTANCANIEVQSDTSYLISRVQVYHTNRTIKQFSI